jgi:hypothetical protein
MFNLTVSKMKPVFLLTSVLSGILLTLSSHAIESEPVKILRIVRHGAAARLFTENARWCFWA